MDGVFCTLMESEMKYSNRYFYKYQSKLEKSKFFHKRLLFRIRDRALRNRTLENPSQCEGFETKKGLDPSRADVSGNACHFCEADFDFLYKIVCALF